MARRSYHLIATASRDKSAKLWHLKESDLGDSLHATCACELAHSSQARETQITTCHSQMTDSPSRIKVMARMDDRALCMDDALPNSNRHVRYIPSAYAHCVSFWNHVAPQTSPFLFSISPI
eukprot:6173887-Pleurochrysis_carterae.AAC.1